MAQTDIQLIGDSQDKFWGISATDRSWVSDGVNDSANLALVNGQPFSYWINPSKPCTLSAYIAVNTNNAANLPFHFRLTDSVMGNVVFYFGISLAPSAFFPIHFGWFSSISTSLLRKAYNISPLPNYFYSLIATYDGSGSSNGIKLYLDGVDLDKIVSPFVTSSGNPYNTILSNFDNTMGNSPTISTFYPSKFANVSMFDSVLNIDEIAHVANKRQNTDFEPAIIAKLVEQWSCNQNTNTNLINATINPANNMSIIGQPTNDFQLYY